MLIEYRHAANMRRLVRFMLTLAWMASAAGLAGHTQAQSPPAATASPAGTATASAPEAWRFSNRPALYNLVLSPSGKRVAMLVNDGKRPAVLAVLDLPPTQPPRVIAAHDIAPVSSVFWVNDDRLVYEAYVRSNQLLEGEGGTLAVDHDGKNRRELITLAWSAGEQTSSRITANQRVLSLHWDAVRPAPGGNGREILVRQGSLSATGEWNNGRMARLDTETGQLTALGVGAPPGAHTWIFDAQGQPRVLRTALRGRDQIHVRSADGSRWDLLSDLPDFDPAAMNPLHLEPDGQLIVDTRAGQDTEGLYVFDLKTRKLDPEPLARVARFDIGGTLFDAGKQTLSGVRVLADREHTVWFSDRMAALQKSVDASLPPGRFNRIFCSRCETSAFYVVLSQSDQFPGEYLMLDPQGGKLTSLGMRQPAINPASQGKRSFHWIEARDGLPLPVVVTHPPGSKPDQPLPAVVLVHGGPWVRGTSLHWDKWPQFLATRGWRVIEPDFRGSLGYGERHFTASFKQWGQTMQDDLADAVLWAAAQGLVDRQRVCIFGASYGGYAALMGPVRHPELYRCAASYVGVTDLKLMYTSANSDFTRNWKRYGMPQLIGDPVADAEMLKQHSPVQRVADIRVPVLLAQGLLDRRVPPEHADAFASAATQAGVPLQRINYSHEAHGFIHPSNETDFLEKLEAFLAKSLNAPRN